MSGVKPSQFSAATVAAMKTKLGVMTQAEADLRYPQISEGDSTPIYTAAETEEKLLINSKPDLLKDLQILGSTVGAIPIGIHTLNWSTGGFALTDTRLTVQAYRINESFICSSIGYELGTAGVFTEDAYNGFVVYSYSAGVLTEITRTVNDAAIWKGTTGNRSKALPASITLTANTIYYIGYCYNNSAQTTVPTIGGVGIAFPTTIPGLSQKLGGFLNSISDPTSPISLSSLNAVAFPAWVWFNKD